MSESKAEKAIAHTERIALKLASAAGITLLAATGLVHEAGLLQQEYHKTFGPPSVIVQPANPLNPAPFKPDPNASRPAEPSAIIVTETETPSSDPPNPSGRREGTSPDPYPSEPPQRGARVPKKGQGKIGPLSTTPEGFFESIWNLRKVPAIGFGRDGPSRTMLDVWLERQGDDIDKLDLAIREKPALLASLTIPERQAFHSILGAHRSLQFYRQVLREGLPTSGSN